MIPERLLNARMQLLRLTGADGSWGTTDRWTVVVDDIPCRIQPVAAREHLDGKVRSEVECLVFLDWMEDVRESDRIRIGGVEYELVEVADAAGHHHHLELGVKRA